MKFLTCHVSRCHADDWRESSAMTQTQLLIFHHLLSNHYIIHKAKEDQIVSRLKEANPSQDYVNKFITQCTL